MFRKQTSGSGKEVGKRQCVCVPGKRALDIRILQTVDKERRIADDGIVRLGRLKILQRTMTHMHTSGKRTCRHILGSLPASLLVNIDGIDY